MRRNYILNYIEKEQNPYFDPSRSYDGGGYHQPLIHIDGVFKGDKFVIDIDDTSCGGFGSRFIVSVTRNGHDVLINQVDALQGDEDGYFYHITPSTWLFDLLYELQIDPRYLN